MYVIILAAGYGTRLYPLTLNTAKPLIMINEKPMINFIVDKISLLKKKFPVDEVKIVVNNKFYKDFLAWKKRYKVKIKIINDGSNSPEDMLGAVKDMKLAIGRVRSDCLILGGDNLFEDSLSEFIKFSYTKKPYPSIGLYDVKSKKAAKRFGIVLLNSKKRIVKLEEKPLKPNSTLAASCVYFFPKQCLSLLDLFLKENSYVDAVGKYIEWLANKTKVFGYGLEGKWIDIGHFNALAKAQKIFV